MFFLLSSDLRLLTSDLSFPYALCHLVDTLCAMRSALCDFPLQQFRLSKLLKRPLICRAVSEALPKVFPDGTNLLHFSIRVKAKCFFTSPLCFRLHKGLLRKSLREPSPLSSRKENRLTFQGNFDKIIDVEGVESCFLSVQLVLE